MVINKIWFVQNVENHISLDRHSVQDVVRNYDKKAQAFFSFVFKVLFV